MPPTDAAQSSQKVATKSVRRSLGFASVGKALADVMNKEGKDTDKASKRAKDTRRSSAVSLAATSSRRSTESSAPSPGAKRAGTPESKTITRRKGSATLAPKPADAASPPTGVVTRSASLRPRPVGSGLPKYRPKSIIQDNAPPKKSSSPTPHKQGSPSRGKADDKDTTSDDTDEVLSAKVKPLPQKATYKVDLIQSPHITPPATPTKTRTKTSTPSRSSPVRPPKLTKAPSAAPSSSSSSVSSTVPHTPKNQSAKVSHKKTSSNPSPSPSRSFNESPLARHSRAASKASIKSDAAGNMSHISEVCTDDESDEEDVAMLLAPVAALGAPTPAMPRIYASRRRLPPSTPTRPGLPTRSQFSYISPMPPDSPSSLRVSPSSGGAPRGSILSWEQLADEASKTLGEDEIQNMISDFPSPFLSRAASPSPSVLSDVPESPCLSALSSPGGYGSISQVMLPDVTPSPAIHTRRVSRGPFDVPEADGAIATLLRLQLESAEHTARERLTQLQMLEEENHNLKQAWRHDAELLSAQVGTMENELRTGMEARERAEADQATYIAALEKQLADAISARDKIASDKAQVQSRAEKLDGQWSQWDTIVNARAAAFQWKSVYQLAELEMEVLESDQNTLTLLLEELELKRREFAM